MSTTPTTNYGFLKITPNTEKDIWGPIQSATLDSIDTQIKNRQNEAAAKLPLAGGTLTGKLTLPASAAGGAGENHPHGVAPSAPVNGDIWSTSAAFFVRVNGVTQQLATSTDLAGKANTVHTHAESDVTGLVSDLALKAPLASPALTGTPTAPTAAPGTNNTQVATTAYADAAAGAGLSAASAAEIWAGTVNTKAVTPNNAAAANNEVALTDGATVTVNFAAGFNFALAIAGNRTLAASGLAAALVGRSGYIKVTQDATGNRTLNTSGATWKNINGEDIILSTAGNAVDYIFYTIISSSTVLLSIARAVS